MTFVDKDLDCLPADFKPPSLVASLAYSAYDAEGMHGLPLGVQIIGKRLEEERVLEGMKIVQDALKQQGIVFSAQVEVSVKNDL